jgi:hypothetical protein
MPWRGRAVERIDDEAVRSVAADDLTLPSVRIDHAGRVSLFGDQHFLGAVVGAVTKLPGPFTDTCRLSTSPKSHETAAGFQRRLTMTLRRAVRAIAEEARWMGAGAPHFGRGSLRRRAGHGRPGTLGADGAPEVGCSRCR